MVAIERDFLRTQPSDGGLDAMPSAETSDLEERLHLAAERHSLSFLAKVVIEDISESPFNVAASGDRLREKLQKQELTAWIDNATETAWGQEREVGGDVRLWAEQKAHDYFPTAQSIEDGGLLSTLGFTLDTSHAPTDTDAQAQVQQFLATTFFEKYGVVDGNIKLADALMQRITGENTLQDVREVRAILDTNQAFLEDFFCSESVADDFRTSVEIRLANILQAFDYQTAIQENPAVKAEYYEKALSASDNASLENLHKITGKLPPLDTVEEASSDTNSQGSAIEPIIEVPPSDPESSEADKPTQEGEAPLSKRVERMIVRDGERVMLSQKTGIISLEELVKTLGDTKAQVSFTGQNNDKYTFVYARLSGGAEKTSTLTPESLFEEIPTTENEDFLKRELVIKHESESNPTEYYFAESEVVFINVRDTKGNLYTLPSIDLISHTRDMIEDFKRAGMTFREPEEILELEDVDTFLREQIDRKINTPEEVLGRFADNYNKVLFTNYVAVSTDPEQVISNRFEYAAPTKGLTLDITTPESVIAEPIKYSPLDEQPLQMESSAGSDEVLPDTSMSTTPEPQDFSVPENEEEFAEIMTGVTESLDNDRKKRTIESDGFHATLSEASGAVSLEDLFDALGDRKYEGELTFDTEEGEHISLVWRDEIRVDVDVNEERMSQLQLVPVSAERESQDIIQRGLQMSKTDKQGNPMVVAIDASGISLYKSFVSSKYAMFINLTDNGSSSTILTEIPYVAYKENDNRQTFLREIDQAVRNLSGNTDYIIEKLEDQFGEIRLDPLLPIDDHLGRSLQEGKHSISESDTHRIQLRRYNIVPRSVHVRVPIEADLSMVGLPKDGEVIELFVQSPPPEQAKKSAGENDEDEKNKKKKIGTPAPSR